MVAAQTENRKTTPCKVDFRVSERVFVICEFQTRRQNFYGLNEVKINCRFGIAT
jgi:hypothetical protein